MGPEALKGYFMNLKGRLPGLFLAAFLLFGLGLFISAFTGGSEDGTIVSVKVPSLSARAQQGQIVFDANCASCHGVNGAGSGKKGPPLVHDIYNPGHHADEAFIRAARFGVRQHHWRFGDMPKQPNVSPEDARTVIRYIRELQQANGIFYQPHRM